MSEQVFFFLEIEAGKGPTGQQLFLQGAGGHLGSGDQGWINQAMDSSDTLSSLLAIWTQKF